MKNLYLIPFLIFSATQLTSCNLYTGLSKPSSDEQYLVAARACLDQNDYDCALSNYKALSNSYNDIKINESSLTTLAKNQVFSFSDFIGSLGSSNGSSATFTQMSTILAGRSANTGSVFQLIQQTYRDNAGISNTKLKAFSQFISAFSMFNSILSTAVGADGLLSANDIVNSTSCLSDCSVTTTCTAPSSTNLTFSVAALDMDTDSAASWNGGATIQKLIQAASKANSAANAFTGNSSSGIFSSLQTLASISGAEGVIRCSLANALNLK